MPAIEGYLDGARFNLDCVGGGRKRRQLNSLRTFSRRYKRWRRFVGKRRDRSLVPSDSIIHELVTDHPIAKAYLIEQYGPVVKVADFETLQFTSRGLMKDGRASGPYSLCCTSGVPCLRESSTSASPSKAEEDHEKRNASYPSSIANVVT